MTTTTADKAASRNIVVFGGYGFMGSHICRALVNAGWAVRIFDKTYAHRRLIADIESQVEIFEGDAARPDDALAALQGIDTVVHLIHTTVPGSSMVDPSYDVESNVVASVRWLSRLGETGVRRIVYISSGGTVYGIPHKDLIDELHSTDPISSYGITKLTIEKYLAMYCSLNGVRHLILRPSNVYGEGQRLHIGQGVIGVLADNMLRSEPVEVWGSGETLRDYLYIEDFVSAVLATVDYDGAESIFNVSSGIGHSVRDILSVLQRDIGRKANVVYKPPRGFDVPVNVLDFARLQRETGWRPRVSLPEGVARVVRWLRDKQGQNPALRAAI
jgi:UDP-glucose 4-epimerase